MSKITRRRALSIAGATLGTGALAAGVAATASVENPPRPRYVPVSPREAAALAYEVYPHGSCMYATVRSIVTLVGQKDPSAVPPVFFDMFKYGHGGCGGWGTICGGCNGAAAVIGLFHQDKKLRDGLISRFFRWYESTELPRYSPPGSEDKQFPRAAAGSVLCHISIDSWCKAADEEPLGKTRKQRCRRLTADVAQKVVELLNAQHTSQFIEDKEKPEIETVAPRSCIQCHCTPGEIKRPGAATAPKSLGKMDCAACHEMRTGHPDIKP